MMLVRLRRSASGGGSDPSSTVQGCLRRGRQSGGLAKLDDFACAAQKGKIAEAFGGAAGIEQLHERRHRPERA